MKLLTMEDFSSKRGDDFEMIVENEGLLNLVLTEIVPINNYHYPDKKRESFSLFFEGTKNKHCKQSIYRLRHGSGWEEDIFLVPIGSKPDGTFRYQAIFN